jgi:hypothetical protein
VIARIVKGVVGRVSGLDSSVVFATPHPKLPLEPTIFFEVLASGAISRGVKVAGT